MNDLLAQPQNQVKEFGFLRIIGWIILPIIGNILIYLAVKLFLPANSPSLTLYLFYASILIVEFLLYLGQYLILRPFLSKSGWLWLVVTFFCFILGELIYSLVFSIGAAINQNIYDVKAFTIFDNVLDVSLIWFGQWWILKKYFNKSGWWLLVSFAGYLLYLIPINLVPEQIDKNALYYIIGNAIYYGLALGVPTGLLLAWLTNKQSKNSQPELHNADAELPKIELFTSNNVYTYIAIAFYSLSIILIYLTGGDGVQLSTLGIVQIVTSLVAFIFFLLWFSRSYKNLFAFGVQNLKYSPGWAVGSFFVPILDFYRPYQIMAETWKASQPVNAPGKNWEQNRVAPIINWWWVSIITSIVCSRVIAGIVAVMSENSYIMSNLINCLAALVTLFWVLVIFSLNDRQNAKYRLCCGKSPVDFVEMA